MAGRRPARVRVAITLIVVAGAVIGGALAAGMNIASPPTVSVAVAPTESDMATPTGMASPSAGAVFPTASTTPPPATPSPAPTAAPVAEESVSPSPPPSDGTAPLPDSLVATEWDRIPTARRVVALTFDAGANADAVRSIVTTLQERETPATFFLTGSWTRRYPVRAHRIARRYPVGNHSDTHPDFTALTNRQVRRQIRAAAISIGAVGGGDPRPLFRFPFGARTERTIAQVNRLGYGSIRWTVDSLGWQGTSGGMSARRVVRRVVAALRPGAIVLMHVGSNPDDGSMLDARALGRVIDAARSHGYRFVTLRRALDWQPAG